MTRKIFIALMAAVPLLACAQDGQPENRAEVEARNGIEMAEQTPPPTMADNGSGAAGGGEAARPRQGDEKVRDGGSEPAGPPPADEADQCGASRYQWLVGRPRSAIPAKPAGANWRIACTGCPITMDYSPERMNIFYDSETERIDEVRCG